MLVKTDPLIPWLDLSHYQVTGIYPILICWSHHTCGSFCHMIVNLYLKAVSDMRFADYRLFLFTNG